MILASQEIGSATGTTVDLELVLTPCEVEKVYWHQERFESVTGTTGN